MSTVERVAKWLVWGARLTKGWLPQVLGMATTVFAAIWGAYSPDLWDDGLWAFIVAVALAILSLLTQILYQRPSYMELARLREEAEAQSGAKSEAIEQALTILLRKLAEFCEMASNNDRASVYFYHDDTFVMLSRWSAHPEYTRPGRRKYPARQGAVGEAWDKGFAVQSLPIRRATWDARLEREHGFPPGTASTLSMHCPSIAALRIEANHHAVGVIVFESTEAGRANATTLKTAGESMLYATLCELVGGIAALTPRVEAAVKDGAGTSSEAPTKNWKPAARSVGTAMERA
jgi:hypothetical protein